MDSQVEGFTNLDNALSLYQVTSDEVNLIQDYAKEAHKLITPFIEAFYKWLPEVPEFKSLFSRAGLVDSVKKRQTIYWQQLFNCDLDDNYLRSRLTVGEVHATINLPISSYVAGMSFAVDWWAKQIESSKVKNGTALVSALNKLFLLDISIVSSSYSQASNVLIEKQSRALLELSTPTIQLWEGILVLPILGILDSHRAQEMTDVMLNKIQETSALSIIIDITGVPTVDSSVANHLIKITKATRLMGCECILSGIGPEVAQSLVHLGVNLDTIETSSNLKAAFQQALTKAGHTIKLKNKITTTA